METRSYEIEGRYPLLMHNGRLADPMNAHSKALKSVTSKRGKTDEHHSEISRIEFIGSLYWNDGRAYLPRDMLEAMLIEAGRKRKLGKQIAVGARLVADAVFDYEGPTTPEELFESDAHRFVVGVRVGQQRVMRTRPRFDNWKATFSVAYDTEQVTLADLDDILRIGGEVIGIGDWRPKFGLFTVKN